MRGAPVRCIGLSRIGSATGWHRPRGAGWGGARGGMWGGGVEGVAGVWLVVSAVPLELRDGRLRLAEPRVENVSRWLDGAGFVDGGGPGGMIANPWSWGCAPPR